MIEANTHTLKNTLYFDPVVEIAGRYTIDSRISCAL